MNRKFGEICEATLWDNLKRKANETLRSIENIKDTQDKLNEFDPEAYPKKIQKILENIGKQFFKIFLFQTLKDRLGEDQTKWSNEDIDFITKDFYFYFWPGYTTLKSKRIFMVGSLKNHKSQDRFFVGIGNNKLKLSNKKRLNEYFVDIDSNPDILFDYDKHFWVSDIPSTVAFDSVLNQYYIDKLLGKDRYIVGSTHFWKSSQLKLDSQDDEVFIPMPLSADNSEFRILEVAVGKDKPKHQTNKISIFITPRNLLGSGKIIAEHLNKNNIGISWKYKKDKDNYVPWPLDKFSNKKNINDSKLKEIQIISYSYWLSETLNNPESGVLNYSGIRSIFEENDLKEISQNILPFKKFKSSYFDQSKLTEIYYNNWYTLFLESYSKDVDLGTAMFLTSEKYDSDFLMKCSNWIRWIFNELRLMEANANEEISTEQQTFRLLKHTQRHYINALNTAIQQIKQKSNKKSSLKLLEFATNMLDGHLDVIESIQKRNELSESLKNSLGKFDELAINNIFNSTVDLFIDLLSDNVILSNSIKNVKNRDIYRDKITPILKSIKLKKEIKSNVPEAIISIIFKEILLNMLENVDIKSPILEVIFTEDDLFVSIRFSNNVDDFHIKNYSNIYKKLNSTGQIKGRIGWWVITNLIQDIGGKWEMMSLDDFHIKKMFSITIKLLK